MLDDEDFLNRRYYGGDLPVDAERHLHAAGLSFSDGAKALTHLDAAKEIAPDHMAVAIGRYKFFLYKHRYAEALPEVTQCLKLAGRKLNAPADFRLVDPDVADFQSLDDRPRTYLFSLMAYGYILARLGKDEEAREALGKVAELDPADKIGAQAVLAIMDARDAEDEDEDAEDEVEDDDGDDQDNRANSKSSIANPG